MTSSRMLNAKRNAIWGIVYKVVTLFLPFIVRTIMIKTLGAEYLGLSSLFTSVLNVLSLAELGFGTAMVYAMYKPIAEDDTDTICALLNLYKKIYRGIGTLILVLGLCLMPFIRFFISGNVPTDINIYWLFGIYLINTAVSYFLFAYMSSVLTACQRHDIPVKVQTCAILVKCLLQIAVLLTIKNYYAYVVILPVTTIAGNLATAYFARKYYPQYVCRGEISSELQHKIKSKTLALLSVKITSVIYNSVDSIVISAFLGLTLLTKYNNYYYLMNSIIALITVIFNSITASLGNSIVVESKEKNYKDFMNLSFINAWIVGWCSICLFCLYQPFMVIWMGEDMLFENGIMVCFCIYFYVFQLKSVQSVYKDAAGLWREDMWRAYASNIFNLVVNLLLVRVVGVYGILLSTILALLVISYPWQTWIIHKKLFETSMKPYIRNLLVYSAVTVVVALITQNICGFVPFAGWTGLFMKAAICVVIPNVLILIIACKTNEFKEMLRIIRKLIKKV